jgi:hypothetical protein
VISQRKRFACPTDLLRQAEAYARMDHRTFSELVCEALRQHMKRYPKKGAIEPGDDIASSISELEKIVRQGYPQVPCSGPGVST